MAYETHETITRLWQRFLREQLAEMPAEQRHAFEQEFESRLTQLQKEGAGEQKHGFIDLIGFSIIFPLFPLGRYALSSQTRLESGALNAKFGEHLLENHQNLNFSQTRFRSLLLAPSG